MAAPRFRSSVPMVAGSQSIELKGSMECTICDQLVGDIETYVAENKTETEIVALLEKVCNGLGIFKAPCNTIVGAYAPQLIALVEAKEPADKICAQVGLCKNATQTETMMKEKMQQVRVGRRFGGSLECTVCDQLVGDIETYVSENKTETQIIALLEKVCNGLGPLKATCDTVVGAYAPQLIALVEAKEPADKICAQVGLCKNTTSSLPMPPRMPRGAFPPMPRSEKVGSIQCTICGQLVGDIETWVAENKTESEIITLLEGVCNGLGILKSPCDLIIQSYGPQMIALIEAKEPADKVCSQVGLCALPPPSGRSGQLGLKARGGHSGGGGNRPNGGNGNHMNVH